MGRPLGSRYLLEEPLGRGATGTVWRGRLRETGEAVAVKVLREELASDPEIVTRFLRERSLLLRLRHPNLVQIRDLVAEGDVLALVMELIEGPDLRVYLRESGPLPPYVAARLLSEVLDGLAAAHAAGIVHRDLKPANILLRLDGDRLWPLLSDFGIARLADGPALTRTHELLGTPQYVAPESALGERATAAVDVYAAGIILHELLTGEPPFDDDGGGTIGILRQHVEEEPRRASGVPDPVWQLIVDCLRKDPRQRPDATTLANRLRRVAGLPTSATNGRMNGSVGAPANGSPNGSLNRPAGGAAASAVPAGGTRPIDSDDTALLPPRSTSYGRSARPDGRRARGSSVQDMPPTLIDRTPPLSAAAPPVSPVSPRPTPGNRPWREPPARRSPPPAAPRTPAPPPRTAPPAAPGREWEPERAAKPRRRRRGLLRIPGIPGSGCLIKLAILAVLLAAAYQYVASTPVGHAIGVVVTQGPDAVTNTRDKVNEIIDQLKSFGF